MSCKDRSDRKRPPHAPLQPHPCLRLLQKVRAGWLLLEECPGPSLGLSFPLRRFVIASGLVENSDVVLPFSCRMTQGKRSVPKSDRYAAKFNSICMCKSLQGPHAKTDAYPHMTSFASKSAAREFSLLPLLWHGSCRMPVLAERGRGLASSMSCIWISGSCRDYEGGRLRDASALAGRRAL